MRRPEPVPAERIQLAKGDYMCGIAAGLLIYLLSPEHQYQAYGQDNEHGRKLSAEDIRQDLAECQRVAYLPLDVMYPE